MLYNINSLDSSVGRATGSHHQGYGFKPHGDQNCFFLIIKNFSINKKNYYGPSEA